MFTRRCLAVGSSSYSTALFPVPLETARAAVPDDYFTVAEILPGQAVFFVGTGEFRKADLGPYKELYVGFYTENREKAEAASQASNFEEFTKNESKMNLWKNWANTPTALNKMDEIGSTVFRLGTIDRHDGATATSFVMQHEIEGRIELSVPRESEHMQSDIAMKRTHYGRLNSVPSRVRLDMNIDRMVTNVGAGTLTLDGPIANACAQLGVPEQCMVSIWIDEMNFKIGTPLQFLRGDKLD